MLEIKSLGTIFVIFESLKAILTVNISNSFEINAFKKEHTEKALY